MAKVNMFTADKMMSERVVEFMRCKVWGIVLKKRYQLNVEKIQQKIAILEESRGDNTLTDEQVDELIAKGEEQIVELTEAHKKQLEEEAKFIYLDIDNQFFKAYKSAEDNKALKNAVIFFCDNWGLKVEKTSFLDDLCETISGRRKLGASAIIRSEAKKFTDAKRTKGDVLALLYGRLAEKMIEVGTIKPQSIPEDIREAYAPKKRG